MQVQNLIIFKLKQYELMQKFHQIHQQFSSYPTHEQTNQPINVRRQK